MKETNAASHDILIFINTMLAEINLAPDWRRALDNWLSHIYRYLLFDHITIFSSPANGGDVLYARAVGRARSAEADVDWGVNVAQLVFEQGRVIRLNRDGGGNINRNEMPFFLGIPIRDGDQWLAALVLVRFGGPAFSETDQLIGQMLGNFLAIVMTRQKLRERVAELERLERQMLLQEDFVSTISHELRTPLGFIKGYTTSLLRPDTEWDRATQQEFLEIIDEETDRLAELIEKILESARLQSDTLPLNFQPVRLDVLLRDATVRAMTHDRKMKVTMDVPALPPVLGDSVRLAQVFENFFSNARKYAAGSEIEISARQENGWVVVSFRDYGPGIPPEHLPFIFERFYRIPGKDGIKGTGLGLYIAREIIDAHHGTIAVESEPGKGATFIVRLPVMEPERK